MLGGDGTYLLGYRLSKRMPARAVLLTTFNGMVSVEVCG